MEWKLPLIYRQKTMGSIENTNFPSLLVCVSARRHDNLIISQRWSSTSTQNFNQCKWIRTLKILGSSSRSHARTLKKLSNLRTKARISVLIGGTFPDRWRISRMKTKIVVNLLTGDRACVREVSPKRYFSTFDETYNGSRFHHSPSCWCTTGD